MQTNKIEWREVELDEIGEIVTGNTPPRNNVKNYGDKTPWIKPPNLDKEKYVITSDEYLSESGAKIARLLPKGAVLVSCIGNLGKMGIAGKELCTNQQINSIIPKKEISAEYLYYAIKKFQKRLEKRASSAVVPLLNKSEFSRIKIPLPFSNGKPDLKEQKRIVSILEQAEKQKERGEKTGELLDEYLKSVFNKMFYNKGFEEVKLGNEKYFEITMGQSPAGTSYNKIGKGTPFFQGKKEFGEKYPSVEQWTTEPSKLAKPNDILISVRAPVGSINLANIKCCIGRGLASIRCKEDIKMDFVYSFLKVKEKEIENLGNGSTFKAITSGQLLGIKIPLPSSPLQQKFVKIVEQVEKMKEHIKYNQKNSEELFNSLMSKAFRGEL